MPKIVGHTRANPSRDDFSGPNLLFDGEAALLLNPLNCDFPVLGFVVAAGLAYFAWERELGSDAERLVLEYLASNPQPVTEGVPWHPGDEGELVSGEIDPEGAPVERGVYQVAKRVCQDRLDAYAATKDASYLLPFNVAFADAEGNPYEA